MPVATGGRSLCRVVGAAILFLTAILVAVTPSRADEDPFSATVKVDATADTVAKARDLARIDGQRRALAALAESLGGGSAAAKLPKLDDKAITNLVSSFEVAHERMSAVRYLADYTFHFKPSEIRRVFGGAGIAIDTAESRGKPEQAGKSEQAAKPGETGKPVVLVPVYETGAQPHLWDEPNPWRDAWEHQPTATGNVRILVPLGDAGDIAAIDAAKARAGDAEALAALAGRNGGGDAVVALAATRGPPDHPTALEVTLRRYRAGQPAGTRTETLTAKPGESTGELLGRAVAAIAGDIGSGWKNEPAPSYDQEGTLTAVLPIDSLDDWLRARGRLSGAPSIRKVSLLALSRQEATIEIAYTGSIDQLKENLAKIGLDLVRGDPLWRLARGGSARLP
jgi:hypothetical protein